MTIFKKTIYIGSDHAGFKLKSYLVGFLRKKGYQVNDLGPDKFDAEDDYPDFVGMVAKKVAEDQKSAGIVLGGSGQGEAMVANKFRGIRAVVFYGRGDKNLEQEIIKLSRKHNNANILSLGARFLKKQQAMKAVDLWLETDFIGNRHKRRLDKIQAIEEENFK